MLTPSTAAATDLPEGTEGPSESHKGAHGQHAKDAPGNCRPKVPEHPQARTINHVAGPTTPGRSGTRMGPCGKDSPHGPFNQKGDTPPSPAQIPLSRRVGFPETGGGEGGEGGTPCGFFPKVKNERGGTPCHNVLVLFCVTLARRSEEGGKIGRPPPHQPAAKSGPVYAIQSSTARTMAVLMTKSLSQKNSLERKNLAPSRRHAQNSTLYLTSKVTKIL